MKEIPIDLEYNNAKRFKRGFKQVPFVIYNTPISLDDKKIGIDEYFTLLNDENLKEFVPSGKQGHKTDIYIYGVVTLFFLSIPAFLLIVGQDLPLFIYLFLVLIPLFLAKVTYTKWKKYNAAPKRDYILFDRANSYITLPRVGGFSYFKVPFTHLKVDIGRTITKSTFSAPLLHIYRDYSSDFSNMHDATIMKGGWNREAKDVWSFYVWYMDRNRPLPPGNNFDAYRQKDFERRKAAGFPSPLFKSLVPTPEATAEQQLVRETFWKDEDFRPTE